jgi:hypothetical protein
MAPEQLSNNFGRENQQVDVWGFGVTMYQLLSGEVPFKDRQQIVDLKEKPFPLEGISRKTGRVVMKCLQKDREKRYRDMGEVLRDLEEVKIGAAERETGAWTGLPERPRVIAAAGVVLAFIFLFYALALNRTSSYDPDTAAAVEKTAARREYERYMAMAEEAAGRGDYAALCAYLERAKAIAVTPRLKKRTREITAELVKTDSGQVRELIQGQAGQEEKIEKCRQFLEKYKNLSDPAVNGDINAETRARVSQIRGLLEQLQARFVTLDQLPKEIIDRYYGKIRRIEIPGLPRGIQVLGRIRLRFQVTEKGQLHPLYIDDTGLNLTDQDRLKTINTMIVTKMGGISLPPPRDKSGSPVKVRDWEVTFKVGTFQGKIILLHEG